MAGFSFKMSIGNMFGLFVSSVKITTTTCAQKNLLLHSLKGHLTQSLGVTISTSLTFATIADKIYQSSPPSLINMAVKPRMNNMLV